MLTPIFAEARRRRYLKRQLRRRGVPFRRDATSADLQAAYLAARTADDDGPPPPGPRWLPQDPGPDDEPDDQEK
jgi:hypothetical protein